MKNLKAFSLMGIWTALIGFLLFSAQAHLHFREIVWALGLSIILLITHMINMLIYFKVAGNTPYKWFK